jgi:hypothetical protein
VKVYLAGERTGASLEEGAVMPIWMKGVKRRLFSYYYHRGKTGVEASEDVRATANLGLDMFLDSGAFTAFTQNVEIPVDHYGAWINENASMFETISCLDAIGKGEKASYDNQKALESLGCKVQPVFHAREDPAWLTKYLDEGYDYIFIGGMVPETTNWLKGWLDDLFDKYLTNPDGTARVKLHGFGLTDQQLMFRYPWHSIDSTSWLMTGVFGACTFYNPATGRLLKVVMSEDSPQSRNYKGWHYNTLSPVEKEIVDKMLAKFDVTAEQCATHYSFRDAVNAAAYQDLEHLGATHFKKEQETLF